MTLSQAILVTLTYHDIFDFPLTKEEIHRYLIGQRASLKSIEKELERLLLANTTNMFALRGKQKLFPIRSQRTKYSQKKLTRAHFYSNLLTLIPTVKLVAISGALAMENSHKNDDIDLVIITAKNTLWTTRFLANLILLPFKRKPTPPLTINYLPLTNNKACLNLFLDESDLKIKDQNLYTAHEICQMKPLLDRNQTYSRFIKANSWIKKYLPNWQPQPSPSVIPLFTSTKERKAGVQKRSAKASTVEILLKKFQLAYMKSKISTERIGEHQLFFHPTNTQEWVLKEYQKRLRALGHSVAKR